MRDQKNQGRCLIFPGIAKKIDWSFKDPSAFQGEREEKLKKTREVRDAIRAAIEKWIPTVSG